MKSESKVRTKAFLKAVVVGDSFSGKTSLSKRYMTGKYSQDYRATVGADFFSTRVSHNDGDYSLQIWDTAGQERFQSIGSAFYRGSECAVLVFDLTKSTGLASLEKWKTEVLNHTGSDDEDMPFIVLGNKCDLAEDRKVDRSDVEQWCL